VVATEGLGRGRNAPGGVALRREGGMDGGREEGEDVSILIVLQTDAPRGIALRRKGGREGGRDVSVLLVLQTVPFPPADSYLQCTSDAPVERKGRRRPSLRPFLPLLLLLLHISQRRECLGQGLVQAIPLLLPKRGTKRDYTRICE